MKRIHAFAIACSLASACCFSQVSTPGDHSSFSLNAVFDFPGRWENGFLLRQGYFEEGGQPVTLYNAAGTKVREATVELADSQQTELYAASVAKDGMIFASGRATGAKGIAHFIADVGTDGKMARAVQTDAFIPSTICAADDGTVWSFGRDSDKDLAKDTSYNMLRHYSLTNGLIGSFLSRGDFPDHNILRGYGDVGAMLRCTPRGVFLYINDTDEWITVGPGQSQVQRWRISGRPGGKQGLLFGFTITESGTAYASFQWYEDSKFDGDARPVMEGLFRLHLNSDHSTGAWIAVPSRTGSIGSAGVVSQLVGSVGNELICFVHGISDTERIPAPE